MAFFRKFKFHYKHKKLSEEWALATSLKDISEISDNGTSLTEIIVDSKNDNDNITTFDLKYLGNTNIDSEKSEKSTAEAIKSVVALSKNAKKKIIQKVKVNISSQGIEVLNATTGENLVRVSIYKISYCSADATNDHVFAFVGSEIDQITNYEQLLCHVFYCPKRKIAHDVTLTVARSFEQAYRRWKEAIDKKMLQEEIRSNQHQREVNNKEKILYENNRSYVTERPNIIKEDTKNNVELLKDLLIDLSETDMGNNILQIKDGREYLQNTWVSFEDDNQRPNNDFCGQLLVC
ncbi:low density lipoprotein receptor adapter protein 1-like [Condylostylus longicornis]|uniref:low density lipoprotein receptor adapter protein 1-like n=1 Tax=Condylostylus longicornis TaxID=2530218 RepID=UPI00244E32E4|nr:low density lipoprotein receptor adapter protein 1-like [Condylostylus longicornis]